MQTYWIKVSLILLVHCISLIISFDPLTVSVGVASTTAYLLYKYTVCNFKECCSELEIPGDIDKLERLLKEKIYGQHLAQQVIVSALRAHWSSYNQPPKPLVLSFHGWPGGGKNYIAGFIKDSLYKRGSESDFVHHFMGRIHFPLQEKVEEYKPELYRWIKGNVTKCSKSLFIFDEVDKMPSGLLNIIKSIIDYNENVEKVDYRRSIFIFLSNTGESLITDTAIQLWKSGIPREQVRLKDFENIITKGAFNEKGGFYHSDTIKSNLIDHYVPFLPMEEQHVRLCILDQFKLRGVLYPEEEHLHEVLDFVEWGPYPHNIYSTTGCKRLSQKVAMVVEKNRIRSS